MTKGGLHLASLDYDAGVALNGDWEGGGGLHDGRLDDGGVPRKRKRSYNDEDELYGKERYKYDSGDLWQRQQSTFQVRYRTLRRFNVHDKYYMLT